MSYRLEVVQTLVQVSKHCSKTVQIPIYEVAILRKEHGDRLSAPTKLPKVGGKKATDPLTGRDRYAGIRVHEIESLREEYARLLNKYSPPVHSDGPEKPNPVELVYPSFEMFVQAAKAAYPEAFESLAVIQEEITEDPEDEEDEEVCEEGLTIEGAPEPEEPALSDGLQEVHGPDVSHLEALPYISHTDAVDLYNAGFVSLEDVANATPEDISRAVHGVGEKTAPKVIGAANDALFS